MNDQEAITQIEALEAALIEAQAATEQLESDLAGERMRNQVLSAELEAFRSDIWAVEEVQQALEAVNRSGSEFVIQLDHHLRTALNGLLGMLDLLLSGDLGADERDYATGAQSSGRELLGILSDVALFCRLDAGQVELEHEPFEAAQLLADGAAQAREGLAGRAVEVVVESDPRLPGELMGDEQHLRRALQHLIDNAVRSTEAGRLSLSLELTGQGEDVCVQLVVADTGKGIPEEDLLRVCEPFESSAGLGLGLAMVRRLVESMEGTFRLESQVGAGTKAIMTFPLERVVEGGRLLEPAAEVSAEPASDRARILVVEDNAINQKVALGFLKMIGCDTATADNGQQGIEALQGEEFDLVLMDCMMPVLDGYKATTSVRAGAAGEEHTSIPIIALTADDSPGARQACLKAGMDDYLTKPLRAERLRALLRIWLPPALRPAAE